MGDFLSVKLTVTHRFKDSAGRVFDAWIHPVKARCWLFVTAPEKPLVRAEINARVGGRFCLSDLRDDEAVEHVGESLEVDRPRRLVFTFAVPKYSEAYEREGPHREGVGQGAGRAGHVAVRGPGHRPVALTSLPGRGPSTMAP